MTFVDDIAFHALARWNLPHSSCWSIDPWERRRFTSCLRKRLRRDAWTPFRGSTQERTNVHTVAPPTSDRGNFPRSATRRSRPPSLARRLGPRGFLPDLQAKMTGRLPDEVGRRKSARSKGGAEDVRHLR